MLLIQQYCLHTVWHIPSIDQDFCHFLYLKRLIECSFSQKPCVYHFEAIISGTHSFTATLSGWSQPPMGQQQHARG